MYLLDTNVVSETRAIIAGRGDDQVQAWLDGVEQSTLYISAITVLELELGCQLIEHRDRRQGEALRRWLRLQLAGFEGRVIPLDSAVAVRAAALHIPDPRPDRDTIIAASALIHRYAVVTRNVGDFLIDELEVINPWRAP